MMEDWEVSIDDFPMPGRNKPAKSQLDSVMLPESTLLAMPTFEQILRYSAPLPAEYHEIILQEAAAHGLADSVYHEAWGSATDVHLIRPNDLAGRKNRTHECRFQRAATAEEQPLEEQITCNDFLRESYPPSLLDAAHSSSSDESSSSSATSLEITSARGLRSSSATLTPQRQRWRISSHRRSQDGGESQSKSIDSSNLYRKLRENLRGASLRSHNSRSSSTSESSQEALQTLQRMADRNPTALNLNEVQISEPKYTRSTLEFCEDKISTWPCGSALQKSLLNELSQETSGSEEVISCRHFECYTTLDGDSIGDAASPHNSRFSWSTIYTICEEEREEPLSWRKKLFKRPKGRPRIPEWLTGYDT